MTRTNTTRLSIALQCPLRLSILVFFTVLVSHIYLFSQVFCPFCPVGTRDTLPPHANCKTAITIYLDTVGYRYNSPLNLDNYSVDNCPVIIISASQTRFYCRDVGTKPITLFVRDTAGNSARCTTMVTIRDTIRPKLKNCPRDTVINVNNLTCTNPVFNFATPSVSDNCSGVLITQTAGLTSGMTFPAGVNTITFSARDSSGSIGTCSFKVSVNACNIPLKTNIKGRIETEQNRAIAAQVSLTNTASNNLFTRGNTEGVYNFAELPRNITYELTPRRDTDWTNGVTAYDLNLISRHILNEQLLTSPHQLIAADVNRDGGIDAIDMIFIRRLILRLLDSVPNSRSWHFVPKSYAFPINMTEPSINYPQSLTFQNLTDSVNTADFWAIKTGDVSHSAVNLIGNKNTNLQNKSVIYENENKENNVEMNVENQAKPLIFTLKEANLEQNKFYDIFISSDNITAEGFQFTLNYDKTQVEFLEFNSVDLPNFTTSNYAVFPQTGQITVAWQDAAYHNKAESLNIFRLRFAAKVPSVRVSDVLRLTSDLTPAEAYTSAGNTREVMLQFDKSNNDFILYQNKPNPALNETWIDFRLPETSDVTLTLYDVSGKIHAIERGNFQKGQNTWHLTTPETSGVIFYRLDTPTHSATKRMVILKH